MAEQDLLFAMDIGTRTVVGIVGYHDGQKFKILAYDIEEHKERAMYDGQVHDIELVAKAAQKVKSRLEKKTGQELKRVAIAAAGRSLKTCKVFIERDADPGVEIDKELVSGLEIEGIQKAQTEIERLQHDDDTVYYCVGYAVVNYFLNGSIIANLEGHKAKKVGLEVLATFLPRMVVDSLYSVVARIGLEVSSLTLEPIAAMNVSIHSNLRLLNIALVDIGAGTSDIALTKSGTVFAFAMASVAGDEITESIAENYLLDFDTAEKVKIALCKGAKVKFKDIMGFEYEKDSQEIMASIEPTIKMLAHEISDKILEYNGKSPSAVFLIGGGSQIPLLPSFVAENLQLPVERVGVRKTDIIKDIEIKNKKLSGPEFITPIGIAVTAHMNRQKDFLHVMVNDKTVKLFNSKTLNVSDALILVGYNPRSLIGRRGSSVTFMLNGKPETVRGEPGETAKIYVNGAKAALDKALTNGDKISIEPAYDGKSAEVFVRDYIQGADKLVYIDGKPQQIKPLATINGNIAAPDETISEGDNVAIQSVDTIADFARFFDIACDTSIFYINGRAANMTDRINSGDQISFEAAITKDNTEHNIGEASLYEINVWINGKPFKMKDKKEQFIFIDIFNYINIDLTNNSGKINMLLNGVQATYTSPLKDGDRIEIGWED